jgi:hypothetical protein
LTPIVSFLSSTSIDILESKSMVPSLKTRCQTQ